MRMRTTTLVALAAMLVAGAATAQARLPRDFFGVVPQTALSAADTNRMRGGGLDVVRAPVFWQSVQPSPVSGYEWSDVDEVVATTARSRLDLLPFLYGTPGWLARRQTRMPVDSARQRREWTAFLRAAVERYGPGGQFWIEHGPASGDFIPPRPIRRWQIWNEPNFFYFATPASPGRYARLLKLSQQAIAQADRRAEVILGGLFGNPKERPPRAMDATDFLDRLYGVRGIKRSFDGVALHPYAADAGDLRRLTEALRQVIVRNRDRGVGLYLTEIGWGSQRNPRRVAFEVGRREQARELRRAYGYLIGNRGPLNLKQVYWFSWKDMRGSCNFCDSVGLFRGGIRFKPKPAWHALTRIAR
jgi:polysaccharide biosynthesis protein PslG